MLYRLKFIAIYHIPCLCQSTIQLEFCYYEIKHVELQWQLLIFADTAYWKKIFLTFFMIVWFQTSVNSMKAVQSTRHCKRQILIFHSWNQLKFHSDVLLQASWLIRHHWFRLWFSDKWKNSDDLDLWCYVALWGLKNGRQMQTTFSNAFSWMKFVIFWLEFHLPLFQRVLLTVDWFMKWLGAEEATSHFTCDFPVIIHMQMKPIIAIQFLAIRILIFFISCTYKIS